MIVLAKYNRGFIKTTASVRNLLSRKNIYKLNCFTEFSWLVDT